MEKKAFFRLIFIGFFIVFSVSCSGGIVSASSDSMNTNWDIILKIENLNDALDVVDKLIGTDSSQAEQLPTAILRAMLQGTDWIDPQRCIVFAVQLKEPQPLSIALVPFRKTNELFQGMFSAVSGPDYYLLPIPPGQQMGISKEAESALSSISQKQLKKSVSLEFFINRVLKENEPRIRETLLNMQNQQDVAQRNDQEFTPEETQKIVNDMLNVAAQMETLYLGLNLRQETITASLEVQAREGSDLAKLFTPGTQTTIFNSYHPAYQMNYKMARFDMMGMLNLLDQVFGTIYSKLGLNFRELTSIASYFTGETAGGMNYSSKGSRIESITVLKKAYKPSDFFETVFFPWLNNYSENMKKVIEAQQGFTTEPLYHRAGNSRVGGYDVVGVRFDIPMLPEETEQPAISNQKLQTMTYEFRMTVVDNLLMTASDDTRLKELIDIGKKLKPEPLTGPMAWFKIDTASYFSALKDMIPELSGPEPMPDMGKIGYDINMEKGRLTVDSIVKIQDIRNIIQYVRSISAPNIESTLNKKPFENFRRVHSNHDSNKDWNASASEIPSITISQAVKKPQAKNDYNYWINRGSLLSAYGNEKAAVLYYRKAIELNPDRSEGHFLLGVSLGELNRFEEALDSLNRAIAIDPNQSAYFYARGRVYLLYGQTEMADSDMLHAAEMGNQDAINYLNRNSHFHMNI